MINKKGENVLRMIEATPENPEKTPVSLGKIEDKLEQELDNVNAIEAVLLKEKENISNIVGKLKNIKSGIQDAKQLLIKSQDIAGRSEACDYCLTPQIIFEEFKKKYKENKEPQKNKTNEKLFNKISLISVVIGIILVLFSTICFSVLLKDKIAKLPFCLYLVIFFICLFIYIFAFFCYKKRVENEAKGHVTRFIDKLVLFCSIILISTTIIYHGQRDQSLFSLIMNLLSLDKIICIIIVMSLLIKLDYMDNSFKNLLEEEKEQAVLSIKQVLNDRGITITIDLIRTLLTFKDEIGSGLISEYKRSIIRPIFVSVSIASVVFGVFLKFLGELSVVNILIVLGVSILINRLFKHYYEDIHDRDLYIEALKDL